MASAPFVFVDPREGESVFELESVFEFCRSTNGSSRLQSSFVSCVCALQPVIQLEFVPVSNLFQAGSDDCIMGRLFSACSDGFLRLWSLHGPNVQDSFGTDCISIVKVILQPPSASWAPVPLARLKLQAGNFGMRGSTVWWWKLAYTLRIRYEGR